MPKIQLVSKTEITLKKENIATSLTSKCQMFYLHSTIEQTILTFLNVRQAFERWMSINIMHAYSRAISRLKLLATQNKECAKVLKVYETFPKLTNSFSSIS